MFESKPIRLKHLFHHETKREVFIKFVILFIILFIYTGSLTWKYGMENGGHLAAIIWSFFVVCTPVAEAGLVIDLPMRLIFGMRMLYSEFIVYFIAVLINVFSLVFRPEIYDSLFLTKLFRQILLHPYPYWIIILIATTGSFLSVLFADELLDYIKHRHCIFHHQHRLKHQIIVTLFIFVFIVLAYGFVMKEFNISVDSAAGANLLF